MPKAKKKTKLKKHRRNEVIKLGKRLNTSKSQAVYSTVIKQMSQLPQLELYPERKTFWDCLTTDHSDKVLQFVESLCKKYSSLYVECKGKHAYIDLQIHWHDFLRSIASSVERQAYEDAQITECDVQEALTSPAGCAWSHLVSANPFEMSKETQFAMLHDIAKIVYMEQQSTLLEEMDPLHGTEGESSALNVSANPLEPLLRMCGSQLQSIHALKSKQMKQLEKKKSASSSLARTKEELQFVSYLSMDDDHKRAFASSLPSTDRGKMRFPIPEIHSFLSTFDKSLAEEVNHEKFRKHGKNLFQSVKPRLDQQKERLYSQFTSEMTTGKFSERTVKTIYSMLFDKMTNLRKKDMEKSMDRLKIHESGGAVTLNLRDELKPYAAKVSR